MESDKTQGIERRVHSALTSALQAGMIADRPALRRCKAWLTRLAKGSKVDLRTNATRSRSYATVTAEFDRIYSEAMNRLPESVRDVFMSELEESNRSKIGPKSMYLGYYEDGPQKIAAVLSNKATPKMLDKKALSRARDRLVSEVPARSVSCSGVEETLRRERSASEAHSIDAAGLDGTTNSGPPFFKNGFKPNDLMTPADREYTQEVFDYILSRSKECYDALRRGSSVTFDAMVGQRIVNRGLDPLSDPKTKRLIIALEKSEAVLWKTFLPQVQDRLRTVLSPSGVPIHVAWSDAPLIDNAMQALLSYCKTRGLNVLAGDFSGFDASVIPSIWEYMSIGMASWFKTDERFFKSLNRSVIGHLRVLDPTGVTASGPSSVKSGSGGTNFVDCQYNKLANYYAEEVGAFKVEALSVQGDDFVVAGAGLTPEGASEVFSHLGLTAHPDKKNFAPDRTNYLQRLHFQGKKGGVASAYRVLASCLVYEKLTYTSKQWNPYLETIQLVSKLENAAFHPAFEELVHYVANIDRYKMFADITGREILNKAGGLAGDLLARDSASSISTRTLDPEADGFSRSATNGVLRGEVLPPWGSEDRFKRVYGNRIVG